MAKQLLALCAGVLSLGLSSLPVSAQQENVGGGFQLRHSFGAGSSGTTVRPWVQGGDHTGSGYSGSASAAGDGLSSALGAPGQGNSFSNQGGGNIPGGKAVGRK